MSCASGGASQGSSAIAIVFQSCATSGPVAARHGERGERLGLGHEHLAAGPGGDRERPARSLAVEVERRPGPDAGRRPPATSSLGRLERGVLLQLELLVGIDRRARGGRRLVGLLARPQRRDRDAARRRARRARPAAPRAPRPRSAARPARPARRRPRRAPPRGAPAARAARTRGTSRAGASGRARARPRRRGRGRARSSRMAVASCFEMRASSACSVRFCLRLAPEMLSMLASTPSRSPHSWSSCEAVLSPMPGTPGDVVRGVALEPDEVGDQLGRDAVAVDHRLAVVDLRVGDAAAGGHHPHARLDQLEEVAVAGDDHHVDAPARARGAASVAITSSAS